MVPALRYKTFCVRREGLTRDLPPGGDASLRWVANAATLISGERDAVVVDTFPTIAQNDDLIEWISAQNVHLTHVYVTHGHGDHSFGVGQILRAFPDAVAVATRGTIEGVREQASPEVRDGFWEVLFPGQIPDVVLPNLLAGDAISLEGHELEVIECGYTDTANSTALWAPDIRLLVGGDVVYNATHMFLADTTSATRADWRTTLSRLQSLAPQFVVAAHKNPESDDGPRNLDESIRYLADFDICADETETADELYHAMLDLHPRRLNPGALWGASQAAKPQ